MTDHQHAGRGQGVQCLEHVWIPMPDGVRLSARIWLPDTDGRVPAILEYIPYRKRDMVRARDERNHPFFAANGFACLRVDMRGSGDSEGHMPDMYADAELADARAVIDWIAAQSWCNGRVGMFGTSWGGTASLQAAVDAPAPLRAVIAVCATSDRFEDDIHWMGGGLLTDSFEWGASLPAILAAPPDAATVGPGWRAMWEDRLDALAFPLDAWIRNRVRGAYWRHGSVQTDPARLSCPILAIGGWSDRYSNSVMRLVAARPDLCRGIVGPWGHHYPDQGEPGPAAGFQEIALAWWDHWLRDGPAPDGPALHLWRRENDPSTDRLIRRNGAWIAVDDPGDAVGTRFHLTGTGLQADPALAEARAVPYDPAHGTCAGDTGYFGRFGGLPPDQAADDARALVFDSPPLDAPLDLVGQAELTCDLRRARRAGQLVARLCEVTPDGRSHLVTRGLVALAAGAGLDDTAPFEPGAPVTVRLRFPTTAYRFALGNRIRLALAGSYWPLVWPEIGDAGLTLSTGDATLTLPRPKVIRAPDRPLPPARTHPASPTWESVSAGPLRRDTAPGRSAWHLPRATMTYPDIAVALSVETRMTCTRAGDDGFACTVDHRIEVARPDGLADIHSTLKAHATPHGMTVSARLTADWDGTRVATRDWRFDYPA
jgi:putative CocE/NonD family hydrolase